MSGVIIWVECWYSGCAFEHGASEVVEVEFSSWLRCSEPVEIEVVCFVWVDGSLEIAKGAGVYAGVFLGEVLVRMENFRVEFLRARVDCWVNSYLIAMRCYV